MYVHAPERLALRTPRGTFHTSGGLPADELAPHVTHVSLPTSSAPRHSLKRGWGDAERAAASDDSEAQQQEAPAAGTARPVAGGSAEAPAAAGRGSSEPQLPVLKVAALVALFLGTLPVHVTGGPLSFYLNWGEMCQNVHTAGHFETAS